MSSLGFVAPLLAVDLEPVIQVLAVTVFVLIPIVRSILDEQKKKGAGSGPAGGPMRAPPRGHPQGRAAGRPTWEDLLRGEVVEPPVEPVSPGRGEGSASPPVRETPSAQEAASSREPAASGPARSGSGRSREPARAGGRAARRGAGGRRRPAPRAELVDLDLPETVEPRGGPLLAGGSEGGLARVSSDLGRELSPAPSEGPARQAPEASGASADAFSVAPAGALRRLERMGGHPFRRAVVLAEVLGRPLGLRDPFTGPSAPLGW